MKRKKDRRGAAQLGWCLLGLIASLSSGCNREETKAEPAAAVSASAARVSPEQIPLADYCEKACKRASECGLEQAKHLAQVGGGADKDQVEAAEKHQKVHYFSCKRSCEEKPVKDAERALYGRAVRCLSETECKLYEKCMNAVDRATPAGSAAEDNAGEEDE